MWALLHAMAHPQSQLPSSTRRMAIQRRQSAALIAILTLLALVGISLVIKDSKPLGIGGTTVLALLILMGAISRHADREITYLLRRERHALRGAKGEEEVERILSSLDCAYFVINDIATPYGNIDHVVLSQAGGVFLIETKSHRGKVEMHDDVLTLNGHPPTKDFIGQVLRNTYWLRDEISPIVGTKPWITAILVFTNAFVPRIKPVKGVRVLNKRFLMEALASSNSWASQIWGAREPISRKLLG